MRSLESYVLTRPEVSRDHGDVGRRPMRTWHVYAVVSGFSFLCAGFLNGFEVVGPTRAVLLMSAVLSLVLSFLSYNCDRR